MRIVYYTYGKQTTGSTRLRAIIPGRFLRKLGHDVIFNPRTPINTDIVVFQKRRDLSNLMLTYRKRKSFVVMDISDYGQFPTKYAHKIVVGTTQLLKLYPTATIIPDILDVSDNYLPKIEHKENLRDIVWFGSAENIQQAAAVTLACKQLNLKLSIVSNHNARHAIKLPHTNRVDWSLDTIDKILPQYDLAVCPFLLSGCDKFISRRTKEYLSCKSANRPLKAWALGIPVIGSPIPAYLECGVRHFATTVDEWTAKLNELRSRTLREEDAARGLGIIDAYRIENVIQRWLQIFNFRAGET